MKEGVPWHSILATEAHCRSPLTPQSNEMRDRLKEQEQRGAIDPNLQTTWNRLHQRSVYLNSLVLLAGLSVYSARTSIVVHKEAFT